MNNKPHIEYLKQNRLMVTSIKMKTISFIFILAAFSVTLKAETPNELAVKIIKSNSGAIYNLTSSTPSPEELARVSASNSRCRLHGLMLHDKSVSEELRICFAIQLLDQNLYIFRELRHRNGIKKLSPLEEEMQEQRLILGAYLAGIDSFEFITGLAAVKAEQDCADQPATVPDSKSESK